MNAPALRSVSVPAQSMDKPWQAPPYNRPQSVAATAPYAHPLFGAFAHAEYGKLLIQSPEGETVAFHGKQLGPDAFLQLKDWSALDALISQGEVGFAETYMDERWDSDNLPELLNYGLVNADSLERYFYGKPLYALWMRLRHFFVANSPRGSKRNIRKHYDLGNDFYALWLDTSMTYSCGLFDGHHDRSLEEAQQAKYNRILDKLSPAPASRILEIGCGWGGFAEAAARKGCHVTAITISEEQQRYAVARIRRAGLSELAEIRLEDYRKTTDQYDFIVSIGMFEHVGETYWPEYFRIIYDRLKPGGKAMVQTITIDDDVFERSHGKTGFIEEYIFPGGVLPSKSRFRRAVDGAGLNCNELFAFGLDYAYTLRHWLNRFEAQLLNVRQLGYDERFIRMWRFYLAACIASFESKRTDVMQAEIMKG